MIKTHIAYGKYVIRHRWFVMLSCFSEGLIWRGLTHDLSKFRPSEWVPYANYFYGPNSHHKYDAAFDFAWLLHQKRNRHHWQWWVLREDDGGSKVLGMYWKDRVEMVCDWLGAGRAKGVDNWADPTPWYEANKSKMLLHEKTRMVVELALWTLKAQHEELSPPEPEPDKPEGMEKYKKMLCWFSTDGKKWVTNILDEIPTDHGVTYIDSDDNEWRHCRPHPQSEELLRLKEENEQLKVEWDHLAAVLEDIQRQDGYASIEGWRSDVKTSRKMVAEAKAETEQLKAELAEKDKELARYRRTDTSDADDILVARDTEEDR